MSLFVELVVRLVEANVSIMSKTQQLQINTAHGCDHFIVFLTGFLTVRLCAIRQMGVCRINIYMRKQIVMHEVVIALLVLLGQALVLIQVYTSYVGEIVVAIFIACYQIFVSADRCGTGCQTQYAVRLVDDQCTNIVCSFSAHIVIIFGFDNSHIAYSPVSDNVILCRNLSGYSIHSNTSRLFSQLF